MAALLRKVTAYRDIWSVSMAHALTHYYPGSLYLLLAYIADDLGLSYSQVGILVSARFMGAALATLPTGVLTDLYPQRVRWMMGVLVLLPILYLAVGFAANMWWLMLIIVPMGICNNAWHSAALPLLAERYPGQRGFALSIHGMLANLGDAVAPAAVGFMILALHWRGVVMVNGVIGVVVLAIIWFGSLRHLWTEERNGKVSSATAKAATKEATLSEYVEGFKVLLRGGPIAVIILLQGLRAATNNTLNVFLPQYLVNGLLLNPALAGTYLLILNIAGFVAAPIAGSFSDSMGRKKVTLLAAAGTSVAVTVVGLLGNNWLFPAVVAVAGFFLYAMRPVIQAWSLDLAPTHLGGTVIGAQFGAQALMNAIMPLIAGILADRVGLFATFYFAAAIMVLAGLVVFWLPDDARREAA